jgi:hypothetical protein
MFGTFFCHSRSEITTTREIVDLSLSQFYNYSEVGNKGS